MYAYVICMHVSCHLWVSGCGECHAQHSIGKLIWSESAAELAMLIAGYFGLNGLRQVCTN